MRKAHDIRVLANTVKVFEFLDYREYLAAVYAEVKSQVKGYSYLEFAFDLGFSRTNVVRLVIAGKRRLTPTTTERIIEALALRSLDRRYFLALARYTNARQPSQREEAFQELISLKKQTLGAEDREASLEYFSEWYHPVIREMVGMRHFRSDPLWIAARLHNSLLPRQITKSLELLERLGLITWDASAERHVLVPGQNTTDRLVDEMAAVRCHQKMIEIGRESITRISERRREVHALTVRISEATATKVKKILLKTCEELLAVEGAATEEGDQIYQMNIQFFPFTKLDGSD